MGKEIWVLDDDVNVHHMIENMVIDIKSNDIILLKSFNSAQSVLDEIKIKTHYVLLVDLYMPQINGIDFLQTLSEMSGYSKPNIYIISNSINPNDIKDAWKTDLITDYIPKPIMLNDLEEILA